MLEHAQPVGRYVARTNEQLHIVGSAQLFEVDLLAEDVAQRVIVTRIHLVPAPVKTRATAYPSRSSRANSRYCQGTPADRTTTAA